MQDVRAFLALRKETLKENSSQSMLEMYCLVISDLRGKLKGLGHAILGNFSTDHIFIGLTKKSK